MRSKTFVEGIIHNPIVQTFVIFISGGWIILEINEYFIENFGLNEATRNILLIILLSALPVAVFVSWYIGRKQKEKGRPSSINGDKKGRKSMSLKSRKIVFPGVLIIIAIGVTVGFRKISKSRIDRALNSTLPELVEEIKYLGASEGKENWTVYYQAIELRRILRNNSEFHQLWNDITVSLSLNTHPEGAKVYAKPYSKPDTSWYFIGETPLKGFAFPRGLSRIRIERKDFKPQFDVILKRFDREYEADTLHYKLYKESEVPEGMVHITSRLDDQNKFPGLPNFSLSSFWMDSYEVTNKEYKTFVDAGGYGNPSYWKFPFMVEGDTMTFDNAMDVFIDNTGWIGPANWELGEFQTGTGDLPVTGISWYEASAYARFVNKSLPTVFHWSYVSQADAAPEIVKFGNFNNDGPVEKRTYNSMTRFGTYDLPGNVGEWIFNSSGNDRFIVGGNYKEPSYLYSFTLQISPWNRNEITGFRCIRYIDDSLKQQLTRSFDQENRDYTNLQPVSNEKFQVYKELLEYERTELNPTDVLRTITEDWVKEITYVDVPYEDAPLKILTFLPINYKPPYQAILYFPGFDAHYSNSMEDMNVGSRFDFFLKSGRAVIWPVYYSSYGRGRSNIQNLNEWKQSYKNIIIDVQITIDYLQTRKDIDSERIAYYGASWGGCVAPYILATEERFNLGILILFGVSSVEKYRFKEFDQIDYIPHVKIPMLLLGGRFDLDLTFERQQAFYDFLGTPKSDTKWMVYETTHWIPRKDLINESLNWLDKYFGPVNK